MFSTICGVATPLPAICRAGSAGKTYKRKKVTTVTPSRISERLREAAGEMGGHQ